MTYEDAVKILLHLNTLGALIEGETKDEERAEAISMAIQALRSCHEQEPLSEEIRRKAAEYAKKECPNPDLRYFYEQAYIAGAMEMASQGWIDVCERMPEETRQTSDTMQGHREWTESRRVLAWDSMYGPRVDSTRNGKWLSEQQGGMTGQIVHGIIAWRPIPECNVGV